jgi:hypothetical protein
MHDFAHKSSFFISLGACRLTRRILIVAAALSASLILVSCGGYKSGGQSSGFTNRVLAAQGVTATFASGGLATINGFNDTLPGIPPLPAGTAPNLMTVSPARNIVAAFDAGSNSVFSSNTSTETSLGQVRLPAPSFSISVPTSQPIGYAAVPEATVIGFPVLGAVEVMNLTAGAITSTIAVANPQTIVPTPDGTQLLVFSNDSNSITLLTPARALSGVDLSCLSNNPQGNPPPNAVCTIVPGFDRPVFAVLNGTTAYVLNCGAECGGTQASVQVLDLSTSTPTLVGAPVSVNGATYALLSGTNLYVAGRGTPTGPTCASLPNAAPTAATFCGTLDIVNLTSMTDPYFNNPSLEIAIPDGYHDRMDISINGQLFVGSYDCTNIGQAIVGTNPVGEIRGCLAILNTNTGAVIFPPQNGDVNGLQSFTSREVEYVAQGGIVFVYDTTIDALLINNDVPQGTINIIGYVWDLKAIDFF